jgi:hypothetical protein
MSRHALAGDEVGHGQERKHSERQFMAEPRQPVRVDLVVSLCPPLVVFKGIRRPALDHRVNVQNELMFRDEGELLSTRHAKAYLHNLH